MQQQYLNQPRSSAYRPTAGQPSMQSTLQQPQGKNTPILTAEPVVLKFL